jgi:pantothenate kinase type III
MVRELIQKITEDLGGIQCQIFATGGDADIFTSNIENITHVGPDFTLRGIAAIYHKNADLLKK